MAVVGQTLRIRCAFTTQNQAADPSVSVSLELMPISGVGAATTVTYPAQIVRDSLGYYHYDVVPAVGGELGWRWVGNSGLVNGVLQQAISEGSIQVQPSRLNQMTGV